MAASSSTSAWKWVALGVGTLAVLGCVALVVVFAVIRSRTPVTTTPPAVPAPSAQTSAVVQSTPTAKVKPEATPLPRESIAPPSGKPRSQPGRGGRFREGIQSPNGTGRSSRHGSFTRRNGGILLVWSQVEGVRLQANAVVFAAVPVRFFVVSNVKVKTGPKPTIATITFETRYAARDFAEPPPAASPGPNGTWSDETTASKSSAQTGSRIRTRSRCGRIFAHGELNLHGFPHTVLSRARLPFRHVSVREAAAKLPFGAKHASKTEAILRGCSGRVPANSVAPVAFCLTNATGPRNSKRQSRSLLQVDRHSPPK